MKTDTLKMSRRITAKYKQRITTATQQAEKSSRENRKVNKSEALKHYVFYLFLYIIIIVLNYDI